ncbi:type II toxin-antitoxin system RelE/ParE family toxin [Verminephrobacter eiseniae]|uniref:type II toxin-antitoxin system RelE/ParE family toxin n=1 Tax=Verminephrobacter eiseniae TaxID=364317 RepID=UPI00223777F5|nr:type II toxin-antitoxin system RelE/ParE family toxin [Verminephrobacter eiseniae]
MTETGWPLFAVGGRVEYAGLEGSQKPSSSSARCRRCCAAARQVLAMEKKALLADAVYVLRAFQKKTQTTSQRDMGLAKKRCTERPKDAK